MRKQIFCTITVLLLVAFNILALTSCADEETAPDYGYEIVSVYPTLEFDSSNFNTNVTVNAGIRLYSGASPESYTFRVLFLDEGGSTVSEQTVTRTDTLEAGYDVSISETFYNVEGKITSVRLVPMSITVSNEAQEEAMKEESEFNFWWLIIGGAVIYFGYKIFSD